MTYKYSGIDISKWQHPSKMDWEGLVRNHDFVIIRACYGVKSDWAFEEHFKKAREHRVLVGAYLFYRQTQGWREQFEAFKGELDRVGFGEGNILPVVDLEWNEQYDGKVIPHLFNTEARALIEQLAEIYGGCIVYLAPSFYQLLGMPAWLLDYQWWVAHHDVAKPFCPWGSWVIWQYTDEGKSFAYPTGVDLNWADAMPPVVDLVPDLEDHEIPKIGSHPTYSLVDDASNLVLLPEDTHSTPRSEHVTVPELPVLRPHLNWFERLVSWLKLWILSRK